MHTYFLSSIKIFFFFFNNFFLEISEVLYNYRIHLITILNNKNDCSSCIVFAFRNLLMFDVKYLMIKETEWSLDRMYCLNITLFFTPTFNPAQALIEMGEAMKQMADVKYSLDDNIKQNFLEPLHHLQTKDLKEVMVRLLEKLCILAERNRRASRTVLTRNTFDPHWFVVPAPPEETARP